jgi:hypothetical protein
VGRAVGGTGRLGLARVTGKGRDGDGGASPAFPRAQAHGAPLAARDAPSARAARRARHDADEPIKGRWVEHPTLLAYITCPEPFQGLNTTPVVAGLRVRLQPKATYELLGKVLREESRLDLEREIVEEQRRANDRLAVVHVNGEIGRGRNSFDKIKANHNTVELGLDFVDLASS